MFSNMQTSESPPDLAIRWAVVQLTSGEQLAPSIIVTIIILFGHDFEQALIGQRRSFRWEPSTVLTALKHVVFFR